MSENSLENVKETQGRVERIRRIPIKLSTAALISVIGPASAWTVGGYNGLLVYIAVYIFAKFIAAEVSSLSAKNAIFAYRNAPWLLAIGGLIPLVYESEISFTILMPILFGSYEGAYWTGYHDFRRLFMNKNENEKPEEKAKAEEKSIMIFTRYEVFCTFLGALLSAWLMSIDYDSILADPGLIAAIFALSSFILPWNQDILNVEELRFGKSAPKNSIKMGNLVSQPFAIVQFVATNGMMFAALQQSILWLGILVAVAEISGHLIVEFTKWMGKGNDATSNNRVEIGMWNYGFTIAFIGLCIMIIGELFEQFWYFVAGWFLAQGSLRGVLRRLEVLFADKELNRDENPKQINPQIGLRERSKFRIHAIIVILLAAPAMILSTSYLVLLLLCIGTLCCGLSLIIPDKLKSFSTDS